MGFGCQDIAISELYVSCMQFKVNSAQFIPFQTDSISVEIQ